MKLKYKNARSAEIAKKYGFVRGVVKQMPLRNKKRWSVIPYLWDIKETTNEVQMYNSWDLNLNGVVEGPRSDTNDYVRCKFVIKIPKNMPNKYQVQYLDRRSKYYAKQYVMHGYNRLDWFLSDLVNRGIGSV